MTANHPCPNAPAGSRTVTVLVGWTISDRANGYSSYFDGYRPDAAQHTETLTVALDDFPAIAPEVDSARLIADAVYAATNDPAATVDPDGVLRDRIHALIDATGYDGREAGHYSLSIGDTVTVTYSEGVTFRLACARLGWTEVDQ